MMKNEDCENDALCVFKAAFLLFVLFLILQDFGKRKQFRHL